MENPTCEVFDAGNNIGTTDLMKKKGSEIISFMFLRYDDYLYILPANHHVVIKGTDTVIADLNDKSGLNMMGKAPPVLFEGTRMFVTGSTFSIDFTGKLSYPLTIDVHDIKANHHCIWTIQDATATAVLVK